jgi:hypothetical protein
MMHDDELDRLLAALPLEEPPPTLHARILAATVATPPAPPVRAWEPWLVGLFAALAVWLTWLVLSQPRLADVISPAVAATLRSTQLWLWVAIGALAAVLPSTIALPSSVRARAR